MTLRELFIQWLTASRFIESLEARIHEQRQDFTERLWEKDTRIKELRAEVAAMRGSNGHYYASSEPVRTAPPITPQFTGPDDWQSELNKMIEEEADGISKQRREKVHEQAADDGA